MRALVSLLVLVIGLGVPAAADDLTTAQSVIRAQEQAFGRDDAAAAYSHAAPGIKQLFPQADKNADTVRPEFARAKAYLAQL